MPSGPRPSLGSSSGFLRRRPDPENDRTGRACSTPAHRAEGESGVEREGGSKGKNNLSLAEELQNLADSRRSLRGIPNLSRHSDSSFDHLSHRSRASQKTFVDPRAAQRSRRDDSPPELLDQFEEVGQRSNTSRVREPPRTRVSQEVSRPAQRAGASADLLEQLALDEQAEMAALEKRLHELRDPNLIAHRDSILGAGARQSVGSRQEQPLQSQPRRDEARPSSPFARMGNYIGNMIGGLTGVGFADQDRNDGHGSGRGSDGSRRQDDDNHNDPPVGGGGG